MSFSVHECVVASIGVYFEGMGHVVGVSVTFRYRRKIGGMVSVVGAEVSVLGVGGYVERSHDEWFMRVVAVVYCVRMGSGVSFLCVLFHFGRGLMGIVVHYRCVSNPWNMGMPRVDFWC
jgi:hypothetical protein